MIPADDLPAKPPTKGLTFLEGVRVIDLTTSVAGPYSTQLLADLGASVVKVERPPFGDDSRAWGPPFLDGESLWFVAVNRNKKSVVLDYASPAGSQALRQLVRAADVVVVNQVAGAQRKLGVDFETLREHCPELIHASITGFGLTGSRKDLPCYDLIAEGYSGVMDLTGDTDGQPQKIGTPAGDLLGGQDAALAILAALIRRKDTGQGCQIDVSLVESMTRFMTPRLVPYLGSGVLPRRSGGRDSVITIYQTFDTADDPLTLGLGNDRIWLRFWDCVGDPDYGRAPRFTSNTLRRENREEIVVRIQLILKTRSRAAWLRELAAARVPAGPINRLDQVADDSELKERGFLYHVRSANGVALPQVGLGIRFDGESESCQCPPPRLGQDTDQVLRSWVAGDPASRDKTRSSEPA